MGWQTKLLLLLSLPFSTGVFFSAPANAFNLKTHRLITEEALIKFGYGKSAIRHLVWNNFKVDMSLKSHTEHHFDSENFAGSSKLIRTEFDQAVTALAANHPHHARKLLGRASHTVQDFFSHSNYVETHEITDTIDLFSLKNPQTEVACDPITRQGGLTSGYYPRGSRAFPWKCTHEEINKDSPKRPNYARAVQFATLETERFLQKFEDTLAAQVNDPVRTRALLDSFKKIKDESDPQSLDASISRAIVNDHEEDPDET
jgi:hypothetical protein